MAHRGMTAGQVRLSGDERAVLTRWAQGGADDSSRRAVRARIVLACAEPASSDAPVAMALGVSRPTVTCWRRRFAQAGLAGLADARRSGRPKACLELSAAERTQLTRWARQGRTGQALALRARIVLACAAGADNTDVAAQHRVTVATVARWRRRFVTSRMDGLSDRPRSGRPPSIPQERDDNVIAAVLPVVSALSRKKLLSHISDTSHHAKVTGATLLAAERRDLLLARLRRDGKLVARGLAAELGVSEDSVRRDLRELAAAGLCQRVYGGALPASPILHANLARRSGIAPESKRRVGARAAQLITPGFTVILDGGTTALEVIKALPPDLEATIITASATTAVALAGHPGVDTIMLSGRLDKQSICARSIATAEAASGITADLALLIMPGVHPQEGFTALDLEEAAVSRIFMSRAASTYAMCSIEKLDTVCPCKIADLTDVAGIITDARVGHPTIRRLRDQGATIIPC
jgi:DeoR/GlpR family transcriptional regulator of sugar metabolism/transposase